MAEFLMPSLGADMEAGTLVEWLVKPGGRVRHGDIIAVVETQKGAIEIEVFEDGVLERPMIEVGAKVPVGTPMAIIRYDDEASGAEQPAPLSATPELPVSEPPILVAPPPAAPPPPSQPPPVPSPLEQQGAVRIEATPAARQLAVESGIDLSKVTPSGPHGEIVRADVSRAAAATVPTPPSAPAPSGGMRAAIAAAMSRSNREIPHYYLSHTIEVTKAEELVQTRNEGRAPADRLLLAALLAKAVALAARKYPEFNGHFVDGAHQAGGPVHLGIAINIRGTGLVAPALHDADQLELDALMAAMRDLVTRVRAGRFRASELSDPTITVSSLGERGVEALFGVIYPPQVAIVGFGTPVTRPWVVDGKVEARRIVTATLAGDHRVSDGHRGAVFLDAIADMLAKPEEL